MPALPILAIDPGPTHSAWCVYWPGPTPRIEGAKEPNDAVLPRFHPLVGADYAVEMIACYGMPVGSEVFNTCLWIGRFIQARSCATVQLIKRQQVKLHLCGSPRANDSTIRQALIDRFGPGKVAAIGSKCAPGPLYGVAGDVWSALALAVTYADTR